MTPNETKRGAAWRNFFLKDFVDAGFSFCMRQESMGEHLLTRFD
jgi:hypothetical protein